jgi:2-polyprenyl-3-methyl-5-hydroxy-6-metoxy-1,4-benzoquinol methylase
MPREPPSRILGPHPRSRTRREQRAGGSRPRSSAGWSLPKCLPCGVNARDVHPVIYTREEEVLDREVRRLLSVAGDARPESLPEPQRTWFRYATSTLDRGEGVLRRLGRDARPGFRFLDVGCAYGGYLVAAARHGAGEIVGLERDPGLARIARELTRGHPATSVVEGDATDPACANQLGQFDVITCEDVLEHVTSPAACIRSLGALLAPGGVLHLTIPNGRCPANIRRDPHFKLFGLTLLPPGLAAAHVEKVRGTTGYDVREFRYISWYEDALRDAGVVVELSNPAPWRLEAALTALAQDFSRLRSEAAERRGARRQPDSDVPPPPSAPPPTAVAPSTPRPEPVHAAGGGSGAEPWVVVRARQHAYRARVVLEGWYRRYRRTPPGRLEQALERLAARVAEAAQGGRERVGATDMDALIGTVALRACRQFERRHRRYRACVARGDRAGARRIGLEIVRDFEPSIWHVVGRKT